MTKIIGFTASTFDLLHAGHVAMLEEAKGQCDWLIAAIQVDPTVDRPTKNKPVQSLVERTVQLRAVKHVDEIVTYTTEAELEEYLRLLRIDVRIIGEEYRNQDFTGKALCEERKIHLYYNSRAHVFSSSELRRRVADSTGTGHANYDQL